MIPYRDDNPSFRTPIVTVSLIALNLAIWIVVQGMGSDPRLAQSVCEFGLVPGDLLHHIPIGTSFPVSEGISCVIEAGTPWRTLFTSMFLHGGWLHVLGNCWFLWLFGNNVEDAMGHFWFLVFYLLCGLAAAAAQVWIDPTSVVPMIGASGAISGIMGSYIILYPKVRVHVFIVLVIIFFRTTLPAWAMLGFWFLDQFLNAQTDAVGGVAVWAHIGGFAAGAIISILLRGPLLRARAALAVAMTG